MNYIHHFGLKSAPFSKEIDDQALWLPPSRESIVSGLVDAIRERDCAVLTGESGVGKTSILRALRARLDQNGVRLTYCHNATLGRRDFYRQLSQALGLEAKATAATLFYAVSSHVQHLANEQRFPVFLLDEAHLLHQDTLDHLHILLNYHWDSRSLLSLILVGLPELEDRLSLRQNRSLYSRIHRRFRIPAPTPADSEAYLTHRLKTVGATANLMSQSAAAILHEATHGVLRDLDRIATTTMREAANTGQNAITKEHAIAAIEQQNRDLDP